MNVDGSVHLSPPLVTSDSREGTPTHRAAIELKYGACSVSLKVMSLPLTVMPSLAFAAVARSSDTVQAATQTGSTAPTKQIAGLLFQEFVYPFELTSFLILIAILGAILLAQREKS